MHHVNAMSVFILNLQKHNLKTLTWPVNDITIINAYPFMFNEFHLKVVLYIVHIHSCLRKIKNNPKKYNRNNIPNNKFFMQNIPI